MHWSLAAFVAISLVWVHDVRPAEACGVKLVVKGNPRQAKSARPSDVLLVGAPPGRLTRELSAKGHKVEVASNPGAAKRTQYAVVISDEANATEARSKFGDQVVIVRSSDVSDDIRTVERYVARRPVKTGDRAVVAARVERKPIRAGGGEEGRIVAAKTDTPPTEAKPVEAKPEPKPEPAKVAAVEPKPEPVKPEPAPKTLREEIYFTVNKSDINRKSALDRVVAWMKANADKGIVIEGHADPTGTPQGNLDLSQRRAEAIRDYIVAAGIATDRIEVQPHGDTKLKYGKADARNRRAFIEPKR